MLTLQDCLDMCDLAPEVVDAIAVHERLPCILAAELADRLVCTASGRALIHRFILDCLEECARSGDRHRMMQMQCALEVFIRRYPGCTAVS